MVEDVELCLEVQVDPDSKKILSNPEKCRSTLLDVTVLKPKELEAFGTQRTNTLTAAEVRKLISSLEKQRRKKQKVLDKLKYDDTIVKVCKHEDFSNSYLSSRKTFSKRKEKVSPVRPMDDLERKDFIGITESVEPLFCEIRRSLRNVETRITNMQDINLIVSQTTVDESASEEFISKRRKKHLTPFTSCNHLNNSSVYRAETTPHDLRSILVCGNKHKYNIHNKIEGKCLCENCGIVGLLMECQKHPTVPEFGASPAPSLHYKEIKHKKKKTNFYIPNRVPSETKQDEVVCVNQLSNRVKLLEDRLALHEGNIISKDYFKKIMSKVVTNFTSNKKVKKSNESITGSEKEKKKKEVRSNEHKSILLDRSRHNQSKEAVTFEEPKRIYKLDKSTLTENDILYNGYTWKWGEEILKPGIDLKNRIVTLLNDILSRFPSRERCSGGNFVENNKRDELNSETIKKFIEQVNTKVFNAQVDTNGKFFVREDYGADYDKKSMDFDRHKKMFINDKKEIINLHEERKKSPREHFANRENVKDVDVSYINPKMLHWQKDSRRDFKGKQEFLKIAAKAKQYQKDILWKNIWTQAKANGQNKEDKITIKIPIQGKHNKEKAEVFETELTIREVEAILKGCY